MGKLSNEEQQFYMNYGFSNNHEWFLFEDYTIENSFLCPSMYLENSYNPFDKPNLLIDFISITNEQDIINFAKNYGLLGRYFLVKKYDKLSNTDLEEPIDWILTHVNTVRMCITLTNLIDKLKYSELRNFFENFLFKDFSSCCLSIGNKQNIEDFTFSYHDIKEINETNRYNKYDDEGPDYKIDSDNYILDLARRIRRHLVNINISGIYRELAEVKPVKNAKGFDEVDYNDTTFFRYTALIEVIYWLLADIISAKKIRECLLCHKPFIQTHASQKYCPNTSGRSKCANKAGYDNFVTVNNKRDKAT